jgi:hypothetical protein
MDGIASFLKPHSPNKPDIAVDYSPDSFLENAQAQFWSMASNETTTYRDLRQMRMESDRLDALRPYIGDNPDYTKMAGFETLSEEDKALVRGEFSIDFSRPKNQNFFTLPRIAPVSNFLNQRSRRNELRNTLLDNLVDKLRSQGQGQNLKTTKEMLSTIVEEAKTYQQEANVKFRGSTNLSAIGGLLAGGAAGSLVDPVNAAATFIGPSAGVKLGKALLQGFALNAGVQAVQQETDEFREWKQQLGAEWGIEERLSNIAFAGFAGSAFEGLYRGLKALPSVSMTAAEHLFRNKKASAGGGINTQALADELAIKARQAHIMETAPDNSINGLRNHEAALRDLDNGKLDVPSVSDEDFISDVYNSKTGNRSNSLLELEKSIRETTGRKPIVYSVKELPEELLLQILKGKKLDSFNAEVKRILGDSGFVKNGEIEIKGIVDEKTKKIRKGSRQLEDEARAAIRAGRELKDVNKQTLKEFLKDHNKKVYLRRFKKSSKLHKNLKNGQFVIEEPIVKNEIDIAVEKAIVDSPFIAPAREEFNPQKIVAPVEKATASQDAEIERIADLKLSAFEGMVERDPEAFVVIDGNATRVADILETVKEFDNHINAFKTCGIL